MRAIVPCIAAAALACGGSETRQLSVGGTYATGVSLLASSDGCDPLQVQNSPTVVEHVPGEHTLKLTQGGTTYSGTVTDKGEFDVPATDVPGGFAAAIQGQFVSASFVATVSLFQTALPRCGYVITWAGLKSGPPNTFP